MGYLVVLGFVIILINILRANAAKKRKRPMLKQQYDEALRSGDKSRALQAGRAYYASFTNDGRLTMNEEQALANDLAVLDKITPVVATGITDELSKLKSLHDTGALTNEEYEAAKKKIIQ
jgi:hypothetical protein